MAESDDKAFGVLVAAPVRYDAREFFIYLFERVCEAVVGPLPDAVVLSEAPISLRGPIAVFRQYTRALRRIAGLPVPPRDVGRGSDLAAASVRALRELRYQRSYTFGVGAEFALSGALKLKGQRDRQVARLPWSFPQLVHELRSYLNRASAESRVVVGIDELDKIGDEADAAAFLNDLKAVFGMPRVFFLISVSEDAMASFERRGQPLRDVFDSSFDHIVAIPPLSYAESAAMLRRRVIGMSWPFVALSASLGGGLPREVIRIARRCVLARDDVGTQFDDIALEVATREIQSHARGALQTLVARRSPLDDPSLKWLQSVQADQGRDALEARYKEGGDPSRYDQMVNEVRARLLLCLTALDVLGVGGTLSGRSLDERLVDELARIRSGFVLGPDASIGALNHFRTTASLPPL